MTSKNDYNAETKTKNTGLKPTRIGLVDTGQGKSICYLLKTVRAVAPETINTACNVSVYITAAKPPVIVSRAVIKIRPIIDK